MSENVACELRMARESVNATSAARTMESSVIDPPWSENSFLYPKTENIARNTGSSITPEAEAHSSALRAVSMRTDARAHVRADYRTHNSIH
jgi:hypothetical protein